MARRRAIDFSEALAVEAHKLQLGTISNDHIAAVEKSMAYLVDRVMQSPEIKVARSV